MILNRLNLGIVLATFDGEVVLKNQRADAILERSLVRVVQRRLEAPDAIGAKLRKALEFVKSSGPPPPPIVVTSSDGQRNLMIIVERHIAPDSLRPLAILWLIDLLGGHLDCGWMSEAFNLTYAEQKVVEHLARGHSPEQIAAELGNSVATIRAHLLRAYSKAGVANQTKLVRLAHLLPLAMQG